MKTNSRLSKFSKKEADPYNNKQVSMIKRISIRFYVLANDLAG